MIRHWNRLPLDLMKSHPWRCSRGIYIWQWVMCFCGSGVTGAVLGGLLDWMILRIFSYLDDFMILWSLSSGRHILAEGHLEPRLRFLVCFVQLKYSTDWPISSHHFKWFFCLSDKKAELLLKETHLFLLDCPKRSRKRLVFLDKGRGALEGSTCGAGQCRARPVLPILLIQSDRRGVSSPDLPLAFAAPTVGARCSPSPEPCPRLSPGRSRAVPLLWVEFGAAALGSRGSVWRAGKSCFPSLLPGIISFWVFFPLAFNFRGWGCCVPESFWGVSSPASPCCSGKCCQFLRAVSLPLLEVNHPQLLSECVLTGLHFLPNLQSFIIYIQQSILDEQSNTRMYTYLCIYC